MNAAKKVSTPEEQRLVGSMLSGASNVAFELVLTLIAMHALLLHGQTLVGWIARSGRCRRPVSC